jgi:hypothetical protein
MTGEELAQGPTLIAWVLLAIAVGWMIADTRKK